MKRKSATDALAEAAEARGDARRNRLSLIEKLKSGLGGRNDRPRPAPRKKTDERNAAPITPPDPPHVLARADKMPLLFLDDEQNALQADLGLTKLANAILDSARHRNKKLLLLWPGMPDGIALAHAVATMTRWSAGDKVGIRTLWYPMLANSLLTFQRYALDSKPLKQLTQDLAEPTTHKNATVAVSFPRKDSLFFAVTSNDQAEHAQSIPSVSVGEIVPHFFARRNDEQWTAYGDQYIDQRRRSLKGNMKGRALGELSRELGTASDAPDSIFGISYLQSASGIKSLLRELQRAHQQLDVIVLPITASLRKNEPDWLKKIELFLRLAARAFVDRLPGIVVVTDEPVTFDRLRSQLARRVTKRMPSESFDLEPSTILWPNCGAGLRPLKWKSGSPPEPRTFEVKVCDKQSGDILSNIDRIIGSAEVSGEAIDSLKAARSFLIGLSTMCTTRRYLGDWIDSAASRERAAEKYNWDSYAVPVRELANSGAFGEWRPAVEEVLKQITERWNQSERGLPMAHALLEYVAQQCKRGTRSMIVFPSAREMELAKRFLIDECGTGGGREQFSSHIILSNTHTLHDDLFKVKPKRMLCVGAFREVVSMLLTRNAIPRDTTVLMTQSSAEYLHKALTITLNESGVRSLKPRIESLIRGVDAQLERRSHLNSWMQDPESLRSGSPGAREGQLGTMADRWAIRSESGQMIYTPAESAIYRYRDRAGLRLEHCFDPVYPQDVKVGDFILFPAPELTVALDELLRSHGHRGLVEFDDEKNLNIYRQGLRDQIKDLFGDISLAEQDRRILQKMQQLNASKEPLPQSVRYWITLNQGATKSERFEPPRGPRREDHFMLFARALEFGEREATRYWKRIRGVRIDHQREGRRAAARWENLLLDSTDFLVEQGVTRTEVNHLLSTAMEHVSLVTEIHPPGKQL